MIETAPFFFIATSFGDYSDCSMLPRNDPHRGG
jgi:hypothetical protein